MKHTLLLSILAFALSVGVAQAATISMSPSAVIVAPGQTLSVVLHVNPTGATLSAVEAQVSYSQALLTPTSFTFAPLWVPVTQAGYDQLGGGLVIKTGGYPGGFTHPTDLGTITFVAKAAGTATIAVSSGSTLIYDANGTNVLSGGQGKAVITISKSGTVAAASSGSAGTQPRTILSDEVPGAAATDTASTTIASSTAAAASQVAAAAASGVSIPNWAWWTVLILVLIGVGIWWWWSRRDQQ